MPRFRWATYSIRAFLIGCCLAVLNLALASELIGPRKRLFRVDQVEIVGNKKIESEAIQEKISIKKGMMIDNYMVKKDIERIYSLKFFETVEIFHEVKSGKNTVIFRVREKPIVSKIVFEGNDDQNDDDLKAQIKTKEYSILDVNTIKTDLTNLQKHYEEKGFYLASLDYELKVINKENVHLVFKIKEHDKVKVKKVIFLGNRIFSDDQLKDIMETREEGLFSFLTGAGSFKEFNFQTDVERIKYFYKTKGHLQVNVGTPEITVSEDKKWVFITIKITEGPKFKVNEIYFDGELLFSDERLRESVTLKSNDDYSEEKLRKDIQKLTEVYQDEGYAFANVLRTLHVVPGENKVDVQFTFEKGKLAYFGKITVKGNTKTRDKVVRRELKIKEGMKYSGSAMRISKANVNRLGFFEPGSVLFNTVSPKGKDDVLDVEIVVKERNTGQITVGAGYSTATKGFLQASISQNNFRGLGQNLSFNLSLAKNNQTYSLGFTEPYLFDSKWTAGGDIFRTKSETSSSLSYARKGFDLRVGYPIFDYTRIFLTYKFEDTDVKNSEDPTVDEDIENGVASSIETSVVRDKRNNKFEPTGGHYARASVEYTGLGGDQKWIKSELDGRYYKKLIGDFVLRTRLSIAKLTKIGRAVPRSEKFVLGGSRNMRGFSFEDIGPLLTASVTPAGTDVEELRTFNLGGLFSVYGTAEIEHPLVREAGLKWVVFYDVGNVYEKYFGHRGITRVRQDYGFGIRWFSPIGVLRFEFGYPIDPKPNEASSQFHFDIGQLF